MVVLSGCSDYSSTGENLSPSHAKEERAQTRESVVEDFDPERPVAFHDPKFQPARDVRAIAVNRT